MSAAAKLKLLPFEIEITSGPHLGQKFPFVDMALITIGRGTENQVSLQHDPRVSRVHVEIKQENEVFYIYNKTIKNSMLINGHKEDQYKIVQSCTVAIGETEFRFILPSQNKPYRNPLQPLATAPVPVGLHQPVSSVPAHVPQQPPPVVKTPYQVPYPTMPPPKSHSNAPPRKRRPIKNEQKFNPIFLIVIVAVIIGIIFVLPNRQAEDVRPDRGPDIITPVFKDEQRLKEAMDRAKEALKKMENINSRQAMAQQFFISGMREFMNGNYQRAVSLLSSAHQSDPTLLDAEKFEREAKLKLDRLIDFYFSEGLKYRESNNYRMCKSSFQTVQLYTHSNIAHPRYVEAKQFYEECSNLDKVRRF